MKVGFDGILLGAWAGVDNCHRILDVGTGTGLIALMLAQRSGEGTIIDAIDIDQTATEEAFDNFRSSPWSHRLKAAHLGLEDYANSCRPKCDLVVCNPPYFAGIENDDADLRRECETGRARLTRAHDETSCLSYSRAGTVDAQSFVDAGRPALDCQG